MSAEYPNNSNNEYKIDPESGLYKRLYEQGKNESRDEIDEQLIEFLKYLPSEEVSGQESVIDILVKEFKSIVKQRSIDVEELDKLLERLNEYRNFLGREVYDDNDVMFTASKGDDFEESHKMLQEEQKKAIILKGKLSLPSHVSLYGLSDVYLAIEKLIKIKSPEQRFFIEFIDDEEFFSLPRLTVLKDIYGSEFLQKLATGSISSSDIAILDLDQLEAIASFLSFLTISIKDRNQVPRIFSGIVSLPSEEHKESFLRTISKQREVIRNQIEIVGMIDVEEVFLRNESDALIRDLIENTALARIKLEENPKEKLEDLLKNLERYWNAFSSTREIELEKRKEILKFFFPRSNEVLDDDHELINFNKYSQEFSNSCFILMKIIKDILGYNIDEI